MIFLYQYLYMDDTYLFHQTPETLAKDLIPFVPLLENDIVLEPFMGEGSFYNNFPDNVKKEWCEIKKDKDWKSYEGKIDWVISNPPFRLDNGIKRENAFFKILLYYSDKVEKGIAFLGNDYCLTTLTPKRIKTLEENGLFLQQVIVCSVKKWRGRYFFMIFEKKSSNFMKFLKGTY